MIASQIRGSACVCLWLSTWVSRSPARTAFSIWARNSTTTSSIFSRPASIRLKMAPVVPKNSPRSLTRLLTREASATGRPCVMLMCSPTPSDGLSLARRTAASNAGMLAISVALVMTPRVWPSMTARLTPAVSPKSSALTINFFIRLLLISTPLSRRGQKYQSDSDPEKHSDFADQRQRHAVIEIESGGFDKRPGPRLVHSDERRDEDEAHVDRPIDRLEGACGDKTHVEPHQPQRQINFHGAGEMEGRLAQHEDEEIARALGVKIEDVIFKFAQANDLRFDSAPPRFIARDETRQGRKQARPDLPSAADGHNRRRDERDYDCERDERRRPHGFVQAEAGQQRDRPGHHHQTTRNHVSDVFNRQRGNSR